MLSNLFILSGPLSTFVCSDQFSVFCGLTSIEHIMQKTVSSFQLDWATVGHWRLKREKEGGGGRERERMKAKYSFPMLPPSRLLLSYLWPEGPEMMSFQISITPCSSKPGCTNGFLQLISTGTLPLLCWPRIL